MKKVLKIVLLTLLVLVILAVGTAAVLWRNEISGMLSVKELVPRDDAHRDGAVYEMHISGGYYLDDFVRQGGASSDAELIAFITRNITKGLIPMDLETSEIACSAFTAQTAGGDRLFGRNYDMSQSNTAIVYTNPGNGRHASVSTVDLRFISIEPEKGVSGLLDRVLMLAAPFAPLDGMNDAGLSCGIFMTYQGAETVATDQQTDRPDFTSTTMLRLVLDYAATVEEAIALIEQYDLHDSANTSYHYMIADATGASAILEWVAGTDLTDNDGTARKLNIIRNTDALAGSADWQCVTNYVLTPGYYEGCPDENRGGADRYDLLVEMLTGNGGKVADETEAMTLLDAVSRRDWPVQTTSVTVHSVIYNLTRRTAVWIPNEHYGEADFAQQLQVK